MSILLRTVVHATALSDGVGLDLAAGGEVAHVSTRAVRLDVGDHLATITWSSLGGAPCGVSVNEPIDFRAHGVRRGTAVTVDDEQLVLTSGLHVALDGAVATSTQLPGAHSHQPGPAALVAARAAAHQMPATPGPLDAAASSAGTPSVLAADRIRRHLRTLVASLVDDDAFAAARAARPLIGLGTGLTPSADDLLVGMLAVLCSWKLPVWRPFATDLATEAPSRTTAVSADLLWQASRGRFARPLHDLIRALDADDASAAAYAARRLLTVGATSGADMLAGVLIGTTVLGSRSRRRGTAQ